MYLRLVSLQILDSNRMNILVNQLTIIEAVKKNTRNITDKIEAALAV